MGDARLRYLALFDYDEGDGGYTVTFPDFGWGVTEGKTLGEAEDMAADCIITMVSHCMAQDESIPKPGKHRGKRFRPITIPALVAAKIELYSAFRESGARKSDLARRMKISKGNIDRLFDLRRHTRLDRLDAAFRVLGKELSITVRDAA